MGVLGVDVGGSGVKGAIVDTATGELLSERIRIATPKPSTPPKIAAVVQELVGALDYHGRVGCSFPTVVVDGQALTRGNIDRAWRGTQVDELFARSTGLEFVVHNDADVAGLAEMTLGAGRGLSGTVIMITIGTGLGTGVFFNGMLIPNVELGRMPGKDGKPIEFYAGDRARKVNDLSWDDWGDRFNYFLQQRLPRVHAGPLRHRWGREQEVRQVRRPARRRCPDPRRPVPEQRRHRRCGPCRRRSRSGNGVATSASRAERVINGGPIANRPPCSGAPKPEHPATFRRA